MLACILGDRAIAVLFATSDLDMLTLRHTAIGDTVATADAVLKLLPMLHGKGLSTFGKVLPKVRKHGRLLKDLN